MYSKMEIYLKVLFSHFLLENHSIALLKSVCHAKSGSEASVPKHVRWFWLVFDCMTFFGLPRAV